MNGAIQDIEEELDAINTKPEEHESVNIYDTEPENSHNDPQMDNTSPEELEPEEDISCNAIVIHTQRINNGKYQLCIIVIVLIFPIEF